MLYASTCSQLPTKSGIMAVCTTARTAGRLRNNGMAKKHQSGNQQDQQEVRLPAWIAKARSLGIEQWIAPVAQSGCERRPGIEIAEGIDGKEREPGGGGRTVDAVRERGPPVLDLPAYRRAGAEHDPIPQHIGGHARRPRCRRRLRPREPALPVRLANPRSARLAPAAAGRTPNARAPSRITDEQAKDMASVHQQHRPREHRKDTEGVSAQKNDCQRRAAGCHAQHQPAQICPDTTRHRLRVQSR